MSKRSRRPKPAAEQPNEVKPYQVVVIAIPAGDACATGFAYDLANMVGWTVARCPTIDVRLAVLKGTILPSSRSQLANDALRTPNATHILWIDSDMRFQPDSLVRLLAHEVPIVGANYSTRGAPVQPVSFDQCTPQIRHYTEQDSTGLSEVEAAGFGFMLMDLKVFRKMEKPYFQLGYCEETDDFQGEDVFCLLKARALGYKVLIDEDLSKQISHCGEYEYGIEDTLNWRSVMQPSAPEPILEAPKIEIVSR